MKWDVGIKKWFHLRWVPALNIHNDINTIYFFKDDTKNRSDSDPSTDLGGSVL